MESGVRTDCVLLEQYILHAPEEPHLPATTVPDDQNGPKEVAQKKRGRGRIKNRPPPMKFSREQRLCPVLVDVSPDRNPLPECAFPDCKFLHNVKEYFEGKPADLRDLCHVFDAYGRCRRGVTCRFAKSHVVQLQGSKIEYRNIVDKNKVEMSGFRRQESNQIEKNLQAKLRKKDYDFGSSDGIVDKHFKERESRGKEDSIEGNAENLTSSEAKKPRVEVVVEEGKLENVYGSDKKMKKKKIIDWKDKLYLAPLTTVGNLPFRRICKKFGADITCGEMAMGLPLLRGHQPEWALLQRHCSEDIFGIQLCGSSPHQIARVARLIEDGHVDCDFVDLNLGCPIDLVYKQGMGSGLMSRKKPLEVMVRSLSEILSVPLTLKMRTGVYADKPLAHHLVPLALNEWGASMVTIHGRSREQRYTRLADWKYINDCAEAVPETMPVYANGDIVNFEDYNAYRKAAPRASGVMVARGALIKPWVFTEIKEQRHWDISAQERLDVIKDFANYGLEHWGSDDKGIETTRRFMLEWLSFTNRYVPFGMLQHPPQRMNERVPKHFKCRNDLETLLSSPHCGDWIKISEMFLGNVPDGFAFEPKHKAHGYK